MSRIVYIANESAAGFGRLTNDAPRCAAALLIKTDLGVDGPALRRALEQISRVLDVPRSFEAHQSGISSGALGAVGLRHDGNAIDPIPFEAPMFSSAGPREPEGFVAFVVDEGCPTGRARPLFDELAEFALRAQNDLFAFQRPRASHEPGQVIGRTHDGHVMRAQGATRIG